MDQPARMPMSRIRDHLKQIIYGGNDGIVTTFAIVAGFAGARAEGVAQLGGLAVLVFGLANLFADAVSMGLGEFLSSRSTHALYRNRRNQLLRDLRTEPESQIVSLAETLEKKGLATDTAHSVARQVATAPQLMAEMQLHHQHGAHPPEEDTPALNGLVTFAAFVLFGALPLLPYLLRPADALSLGLSALAALTALGALGFLRWLATKDRPSVAILETVGIGTLCAAVAFLVGWLVGG